MSALNNNLYVPDLLKGLPNWVKWMLVEKDGKPTKPPFVVGTNRHASSTDSSTWTDFTTAITKSTINGVEGIGFVIGGAAIEKQIMAADIDGCLDPKTDEITPWAEDIVNLLDSYTERTPSGYGLRVWIIGEWPFEEHKFELGLSAGYGDKVGIEVYNTGRYFTVTGNPWFDEEVPIERRESSSLYNLCRKVREQHPRKAKSQTLLESTRNESVKIQQTGSVITDKYELLMHGTATGDKPLIISDGFGNSVPYDDRSAADLALCTLSAFRHGNNPDAIWNDYQNSSLFRSKWEKREEDFRRLTIAKAIRAYEQAQAQGPNVELAQGNIPSTQTQFQESPGESEDGQLIPFDMTPEEIAFQQNEAEFPVYRLKEGAGPHFDESTLYGPLGEVTKVISQYNESDAAAIYLNLIVSIGNAMGRHAYFNVNKTCHYTNEFGVGAGETAVSRKGTGADEVDDLLKLVAKEWMQRCNVSGFRSPQAIIDAIRDDCTFQTPIKEKGVVMGYKNVVKKGVDDKRLCIRESEFTKVLKLMADSQTIADEMIRDAWDGKDLNNRVSGKVEGTGESKTLIASNPMVSIMGFTNISIIKSNLPSGSDVSGSGNRIIWCLMKQLKVVPLGGPPIDWIAQKIPFKDGETLFVNHLQDVLVHAYQDRLIPFGKDAVKRWETFYIAARRFEPKTFVDRMLSRSAPHVRRLAMIFALVDLEDAVHLRHLNAALDFWDYCAQSTQFIFAGYSSDQAKILSFGRSVKDFGKKDVHALFHRHKNAEWIDTQLADLDRRGYLVRTGERYQFKRG